MGVLLAFAVGYTVGARAGAEGFDEIASSVKAIRESEEFGALLDALRSHAGYALKELSDLLNNRDAQLPVGDLLERVRGMAGQARPTWTSS